MKEKIMSVGQICQIRASRRGGLGPIHQEIKKLSFCKKLKDDWRNSLRFHVLEWFEFYLLI